MPTWSRRVQSSQIGMKWVACFALPLIAAVNTSPRRMYISLKTSWGAG